MTDNSNGSGDTLVRVDGLKMYFPITQGIIVQRHIGDIKAVDGLDFTVHRGETLGDAAAGLHDKAAAFHGARQPLQKRFVILDNEEGAIGDSGEKVGVGHCSIRHVHSSYIGGAEVARQWWNGLKDRGERGV